MADEVFNTSVSWFRTVSGFTETLPPWAQTAAYIATDLLLAVFAVLFLLAWWRARGIGARAVGLALFAPVATVIGYAVSRTLKMMIEQERPCQAMLDVTVIATCPEAGNWSFPSNHAAIAGAAAVAIAITWRRVAVLAVLVALLEAFSRVFVGVHYPHDVTVGLIVGALVAAAAMFAAARPMTALSRWAEGVAPLRPLVVSADRDAGPPAPGERREPPLTAGR